MSYFNLNYLKKLFLILICISTLYFIQKSISSQKLPDNFIKPEKFKIIEKNNFNLGKLNEPKIHVKDIFKIGKLEKNCGSSKICEKDEFSVFINTGYKNQNYSKLCIDGKYLLGKNLNDCGRGINLVIIDNLTQTVTQIKNFDTYQKDLTDFETTLLSLRPGDKIILLTFDEPISKISKVAKLLLHDLGSFHVQNLLFRTSWYLISEKKIEGYTPYEEIHLPILGQWAEPHNVHLCIPYKIKGNLVKVDKSLYKNDTKLDFCNKFKDKSKYFCDNFFIDEPVYNDTLTEKKIFLKETLIFIFYDNFSQSLDMFSITLETLFRQNKIIKENVFIIHFETVSNEIKNLAKLFKFNSLEINYNLIDVQKTILTKINNLSTKQVIFIFDNIILSTDFLNYFNQLIPVIWYPNSNVSIISAYNNNCNKNLCFNEKTVYRIFGKNFDFNFAFLVKNDENFNFFLKKIIEKNIFHQKIDNSDILTDLFVPDFSRIIIDENDILDENIEKKILEFENIKISNVKKLFTNNFYKESIFQFKQNSILIENKFELIEKYLVGTQSENKNLTFIVDSYNFEKLCTLINLKQCLCNYYVENLGNVLRLNFKNNDVLIIKV